MRYSVKLVDKDCITSGDTVLCKDGKIRTVCKKDITYNFMGTCIFGDSYKLGLEKVVKVILI